MIIASTHACGNLKPVNGFDSPFHNYYSREMRHNVVRRYGNFRLAANFGFIPSSMPGYQYQSFGRFCLGG
jgi:hypothetical protein